MVALITQHPVMKRFRQALELAYGDRLERVVLYGSRARGEARPDSDWDVAVFIRDPEDIWDETGRLAAIETDLFYETGASINAFPFRAEAYEDRAVFMNEVRQDGISI